jgi:hypothetical protein
MGLYEITLDVPAGIAAGTYPFTVNVVSGPVPVSIDYTLYISDFSLIAPTAAQDWAPPGGQVDISLGAQPLEGFMGEINVTCTTDFGVACTGGSYAIFPSLGTTPIGLSLSLPSTIAPGKHSISVTAINGPLQHTLNFPFYVADYSGSLNKSSITLSPGASSSVTATVTATSGFAGTVSFSCTGTPLVLCSFSPSTVTPTAAASQSTTITVTAAPGASAHLSAVPKYGWLVVAFILPLGFAAAPRRDRRTAVIGSVLFLSLLLICPSCGGSSSSGGGGTGSGGPQSYNITVVAGADGTNTTRTLGTINVTVTH